MYNSKEKCRETAERFKQLCKLRGTTPYTVGKKAGLSSSTVNSFLTGKSMPRIDTMLTLCNQLGITVTDFFAEREVTGLQTQEEENLLHMYRNLSAPKRELVYIYMKMLLQYREE